MTDDLYEGALYARGYIISSMDVSERLKAIVQWKKVHIGGEKGFFVLYDPRNEVVEVKDGDKWVFLLGVVLDPEAKTLDKEYIARQLVARLHDDGAFLDYVDILCGRHIIVYGDRDNAHILQDACGMRSCYYGRTSVASHYNLIRDVEGLQEHPYFREYMSIPASNRPWYMPGDITPVEDVRTLIPNHRLDLRTHAIERIFPRKAPKDVSAGEVADYFAKLIKTQVDILSRRYGLMMSMTGGNDSRVTLSALREARRKTILFSYLNNSNRDTCAHDNIVAAYLAQTFGFDFRQFKMDAPTPKNLLAIADRNHYHEHVTRAIPYYIKYLPCDNDHIHLRSNILEIIRERDYFYLNTNTASAMEALSYSSRGLGGNPLVAAAYVQFWRDNQYDSLFGYNYSDIYYMEYRMGVWHTGGILLRSDIAFDTYCLFNQRMLIDLGLRMPHIFRKSNYLVYAVVGKLWPELLFQLPNSEATLLDQYSPFSKQLCKSIKSVDIVSESEHPYSTVSATFVEVGFSANVIKAGEAVSARVVLKRGLAKRNVSFVLSAFGAVNFAATTSFKYQVAVDGMPVAEGRLSEIYMSNKVVNCLMTNTQTEPVLEIKLFASRACLNGVEAAAVMRVSNFICMTLEG